MEYSEDSTFNSLDRTYLCPSCVPLVTPFLKTVVVQSLPFKPSNSTSPILALTTARANATISATALSPYASIYTGSSSRPHILAPGENTFEIGVHGRDDQPNRDGVIFRVKIYRGLWDERA